MSSQGSRPDSNEGLVRAFAQRLETWLVRAGSVEGGISGSWERVEGRARALCRKREESRDHRRRLEMVVGSMASHGEVWMEKCSLVSITTDAVDVLVDCAKDRRRR